jgi:hypothetical protein
MSLGALFSFPDPVNDVSARIVAGGVVVLAAAILGSGQAWLVAVLAYGFVARAATGPTLSPLGLAATKLITPRLGLPPRPSPGPAKRFAQAIGALFSISAAVLALGFGLDTAAFVLVATLGLFAFLEAAFGLCVGCRVFALLIRAGLVPEAACRSCANIWAP